MGELRDSLTNTQLAYYMALFNIYPMGDEAMDVRFAALLARLEAGLAVVQVKRGKRTGLRELFKRDFWSRPRTVKDLKNKVIAAFTGLGMKTEGEED